MRRILMCGLVCLALVACAPWRPGTDSMAAHSPRKDADNGGPQRPMYLPGEGVMKKSDTPGKVGDDSYVCGDKACKTAIKVK